MAVLYLCARLSLALLHLLVRVRVARLERRFVRVAAEADALIKASRTRGGTNQTDPSAHAKQQYELARLALKRDRVEQRYTTWQARSERFAALRRRVVGYRGRLLPYVFGPVDVAGLMLLMHRLEFGVTEFRSMIGL